MRLFAAALLFASAAAAHPVELGIHVSSIRSCDHFETDAAPAFADAGADFAEPHWDALRVRTVRVSVPWDVALPRLSSGARAQKALAIEQQCMEAFLKAAAAKKLVPQIAFKPDYNYLSKDGKHIRIPELKTYTEAINAFAKKYVDCAGEQCAGGMARVRIISPWGEPDFHSTGTVHVAPWRNVKDAQGHEVPDPRDLRPQMFYLPDGRATFDDPRCHGGSERSCGPVMAARMWLAVHRALSHCKECTAIAGDFSGAGGLEARGGRESYLRAYRAALGQLKPKVWAIHPYGDLSAIEDSYGSRRQKPAAAHTLVGRFAAELHRLGFGRGEEIWLNEISAFYRRALSPDDHPAWTREVQARAGRYLIDELPLAAGKNDPPVTRVYYLRYSDGNGFPYWALVVGGQPQPIYDAFVHRK